MSDEQVNELFRVSHASKGVSGFLEAHDVTRLAPDELMQLRDLVGLLDIPCLPHARPHLRGLAFLG